MRARTHTHAHTSYVITRRAAVGSTCPGARGEGRGTTTRIPYVYCVHYENRHVLIFRTVVVTPQQVFSLKDSNLKSVVL